MAGLIWEILKYRDARRDRAVQEQQSAQKAEMEFRMKVAEKTENWPPFNRWVKKTYPEADIEDMPQLKVGGVTKKVPVTADAARGDIATKEVVEGGVTVTPETKEKFGLADYMKKAGIITTPEQETEYLTGIKPVKDPKPTAIEQKVDLAIQATMLPDDHPLKAKFLEIAGVKSRIATSMWGKIFELKPNITIPEIVTIKRQLAQKPSGRSMTKLESYVRSIPGLKSKSPWQLNPEEMDTVLRKMVKDSKWNMMSAILWGEGMGATISQLTVEEKARLKELIELGEIRELTDGEELELEGLWGKQKGTQ